MATHAHSEHKHPTFFELARNVLILMVLMATTVYVAEHPISMFSSPVNSMVNNGIAMGVAVTKAILVIWFFMGVKYTRPITRFFVVLGFGTFLLLFLMYIDYGTRKYEPIRGWESLPPTALPRFRDDRPTEYTGLGQPPKE